MKPQKRKPPAGSVQKKAKFEWTKEGEKFFLDLYEDSYFNRCNQGNVSQDEWRILAKSMNDKVKASLSFEPQILRNKLDSLIKKYKIEKQSQTGAELSDWEHFEQMNRIRGPSPKEQGIPGALDRDVDVNVTNTSFIDLPSKDEEQDDIFEDVHQSCEVLGTSCRTIESPSTPPGSSFTPENVNTVENQDDEQLDRSSNTPCSKGCSQAGVPTRPNKRSQSASNEEDFMKTMKEFVQVFKEDSKERQRHEREKIDLMKEFLELRRQELQLQSDDPRGIARKM